MPVSAALLISIITLAGSIFSFRFGLWASRRSRLSYDRKFSDEWRRLATEFIVIGCFLLVLGLGTGSAAVIVWLSRL